MPSIRRVPPGRAGRLWLQHRLHVARRGADMLETKLRVLRDEQDRLATLARRTHRDWEAECREADRWLVRGALAGGQAGVALAMRAEPAEVVVTWKETMGVRSPDAATLAFPAPPVRPPVGAALVLARQAYERATRAAAAHAAASAALRVLDAEVAATRRRLRAITGRWIPRVEAALADIDLGLAENERGEGVRLRWAARSPVGTPSGPAPERTPPSRR